MLIIIPRNTEDLHPKLHVSAAWMPPELFNGSEMNSSSDVYSFGVILWEMLTREIPFSGLSVFQVLFLSFFLLRTRKFFVCASRPLRLWLVEIGLAYRPHVLEHWHLLFTTAGSIIRRNVHILRWFIKVIFWIYLLIVVILCNLTVDFRM